MIKKIRRSNGKDARDDHGHLAVRTAICAFKAAAKPTSDGPQARSIP
jgi:hypothetical protein